MIKLGPVSLRRAQRKREITQIETPHGEWSVWDTYWTPQPEVSTHGRSARLLWLEGWWSQQEGCGKLRLHSWGTCKYLLAPKEDEEGELKLQPHRWLTFLWPPLHITQCKLTAPIVSSVSPVQEQELSWPKEKSATVRQWGSSNPKWHQGEDSHY